jgi:hypothetical protein
MQRQQQQQAVVRGGGLFFHCFFYRVGTSRCLPAAPHVTCPCLSLSLEVLLHCLISYPFRFNQLAFMHRRRTCSSMNKNAYAWLLLCNICVCVCVCARSNSAVCSVLTCCMKKKRKREREKSLCAFPSPSLHAVGRLHRSLLYMFVLVVPVVSCDVGSRSLQVYFRRTRMLIWFWRLIRYDRSSTLCMACVIDR